MNQITKSNTDETRDWMDLLKHDKEAAFEELVHQYRNEIFDLCVRISGNRSEAEDLTQETFIKAYEHLGSFRGEANPRTWLYRIATNRSISLLRRWKRWRMQRGGDDEIFPEIQELSTPSPELSVELRDLAGYAHEALKKLPDRQRTAVILSTVKDLPYEEVAHIMGISIGGAKANVHQGLKKLKTLMEE